MKLFYGILLLLFGSVKLSAQNFVTNDGLALTLTAGLTATIQNGGYTNQTNVSLGTIDNAGTITLTGDWTNNSANTVFSTSSGTVIFNGTGTQTIGGTSTTTFYNMTFNNDPGIAGDVTLATNNYIASNQITMTQGNVNLNGRTLTLGTAVGSPGTLNYTAGFFYGNTGTFTRWISATSAAMGAIASNALGHFPMGTSTGNYRPLWLTYTADLTAGGTVSILHDGTTLTTAASHTDATWGTGTVVDAVTNSFWTLSVANGFALNGSTGTLRYGGTGYGTNTLADLDATLLASAVGTFGAATNVNTTIEVNRTGLSTTLATFANTWRIGTTNVPQSPLPIALLSFDAKLNGNNVDVKWTTVTEINNDFFTVEKGIDAINFETVGTVDGAGNSTSELNYSLIDENPYKGVSYYRLKQTDYDGNFSFSRIVSVQTVSDNPLDLMYVFVDQTSNRVKYQFNYTQNNSLVVEVLDVLGKKTLSQKVSSDDNAQVLNIDVSTLNKGMYILKISDGMYSQMKKLFINDN